ncbi:MAG: hypoxanthine phosphoribosyltransferase [Ruminococcus sp.]|nr:hypoxanthine phosphoribosyltransferase [Ruminococcus sp.]
MDINENAVFPEDYADRIKRVLITEREIKAALEAEGERISREFEGKPLLLVSVLKGSFIFLADLCREITIPCEIGFMAAQSYFGGTTSAGKVEITYDIKQDISRYHVVIVEDIIDTGRTLKEIVDILRGRNPLSLSVVTLLDKPERREVELNPDRALFTIPDHFVIGYGLDCGELYRNLPYIAEYDISPESDQ